jgi:predicted outer membrane repeat protein
VVIDSTRFSSNSASGFSASGGALASHVAPLLISNCDFESNAVENGSGGAVCCLWYAEDALGARGWRTMRLPLFAPVVTLRITPQTAAQILADGCRLTLTADTRGDHGIERSTNLTDWDQVATVTVAGDEQEVVDLDPGDSTARFCRVRQ